MRQRLRYAAAFCAFGAFALVVLGAGVLNSTRAIRPLGLALKSVELPARIVFYGDSRPHIFVEFWRPDAGPARELLVRRLAEIKPNAIVHSGDLVDLGVSSASWARFDDEMEPIRKAGIPFYPALGNHEFYGGDSAALDNYFARFPQIDRHRWYELPFGPLLILVTDTNISQMTKKQAAEQDAWFHVQLAAAESTAAVRLVVVVCHHSPYTNGITHGPDRETEDRFIAPAKRFSKARLFVSGHLHTYERFIIDGRTFVVSGGGGAPPMSVHTTDRKLKDEFDGGRFRPFHYIEATVERGRAVFNVMMLNDADKTWYRGDGFTLEY